MIRNKKIVIGICGIGRGHCIRQLPIVNTLSESNKLILFAFGESYDFYIEKFSTHPNVQVMRVVVPWFVGSKDGIDFAKTAGIAANDASNYFATNMAVFQEVRDSFGKPHLVISDYEPTAAQLSYAMDVPLLTLDQQSKYLHGEYPALNGNTALSEKARLEMFLPKADKRIACSFFRPPHTDDNRVEIVPPILKASLLNLRRKDMPIDDKKILVYLSPYSIFVQREAEVMDILAHIPSHHFCLYASRSTSYGKYIGKISNVSVYYHGDPSFEETMKTMSGAISTAGHSFLSEAMFLGRPVFAIPLDTYEQAYNAKIVADYEFGMTDSTISQKNVEHFIRNIQAFKANIESDDQILLREDGLPIVLARIEGMFA